MPIATDESFRIEYSLTRGMEMEFYKSNKVVSRQESVNEQYVSALVRPGCKIGKNNYDIKSDQLID